MVNDAISKLHRPLRLAVLGALTALLALSMVQSAQAAYRDTILSTPGPTPTTPGPTSAWRLGEPSGTKAIDMTNLQPGTYSGTPGLGTAGALALDTNTAMNVDSAGDRMTAPDRAEYDVNAFTVEFWIRLNAYGDTTQYRSIASKGYSLATRNWLIGLGNNSNGALTYSIGSGGASVGRRSVANLNLNQWYHVAFVHQAASKIQLYINGSLDSELATAATPTTSSEPVILGDDGQTPSFANARYDEFALYNSALSASEIQRHYQSGVSPAAVCSKVASPTGSDSNAGTVAAPYRTSQKLADSLASGQTGCFRTGTYATATRLNVAGTNTTLQTYPGDANATLSGPVRLAATGATAQQLTINANSTTEQIVGVLLTAPNTKLRHNRITNNATTICVQSTDAASGYLIERNRIYGCGAAGSNQDHGVYVSADNGRVRNNALFDNVARGLQFRPDADGNIAIGNTIDGNGEAVNFGGFQPDADNPGTPSASDNNTVTRSVLSNSNERWNVESFHPGPTPVGNTVTDGCLFASNANPYYNTDGGVSSETPGDFTVSGNVLANPAYVNRAGKDFRLSASSPCAGRGAPDDVTAAAGP